MKVYVLVEGNYEGDLIHGVYSNEQSAYTALRALIENNQNCHEENFEIMVMEVQD